MAAYGRPHLLQWAIESVQRQSFTDWELLVVADACPLGTRDTAQAFAATDPRIRVMELARNWGEQSGPNNAGIARSRGALLAFLNQDDLWFPDHLQVLLDWLDASHADIVLGASAHLGLPAAGDLRCSPSELAGIGEAGRYCPVKTFSPMSAWLVRRPCFDRVGALPPAADCMAESSQTWLFKAWRNRLYIATCPELSSLIFSSGSRANSYLSQDSAEQAHFAQQLRSNPFLRPQLLAHASPSYSPEPSPRKECFKLRFKRLLAQLGLFPRAIDFWWQHRRRRGEYIRHLRSVRGLPNTDNSTVHLPRQLLTRWRERHAWYDIGKRLGCHAQDLGARHLGDGWHLPDETGSLMQASTAMLHFRVQGPSVTASRLTSTWQLAPDAILYASCNGTGIPLTGTAASTECPGAVEWTWTFPEAPNQTSRTLDFEIHTPTPGCRLLQLMLT